MQAHNNTEKNKQCQTLVIIILVLPIWRSWARISGKIVKNNPPIPLIIFSSQTSFLAGYTHA
jgi:hypothetical protein